MIRYSWCPTLFLTILFGAIVSREVLERQFQQLKLEITNSANSMPDLFQLVQELCNAAEKYFVLKKLFWKVSSFYFLSWSF